MPVAARARRVTGCVRGRQVYSVRDSPLCLTGTAEVPLAAVAMDCVLAEAELPLRLAAFGHCFRTEAGAAGAPAQPCAACDVAGPPCGTAGDRSGLGRRPGQSGSSGSCLASFGRCACVTAPDHGAVGPGGCWGRQPCRRQGGDTQLGARARQARPGAACTACTSSARWSCSW